MSIESRLQAIEERIDTSLPEEPMTICFVTVDGTKEGGGKPWLADDGLPEEYAVVTGVPVPEGQPRLDGKDFTRETGESREDFEQRVETFRQELIQKSKQIKPTFSKLNKRS